MVYIEMHAELLDHPKTQKACRRLGIQDVTLVGHLTALWHWCLSYADDGSLSAYEPEEIAAAARWRDDPQTFLDALVSCGRRGGSGFLDQDEDGSLWIHDFDQYAGKLIDRRRANADRMRQARGGQSEPHTKPVQSTKNAVQDTKPEQVKPVQDTCVARVGPEQQSVAKRSVSESNQSEKSEAKSNNNPPTSLAATPEPENPVVVAFSASPPGENPASPTASDEPEPPGESPPDMLPAEGKPPAQDGCAEQLAEILIDRGVTESVAAELTRRFDCERIRQQVKWLPFRIAERREAAASGHGRPIADEAAFLCRAIEDGYAMPATARQQQMEQEAKQKRAQAAQTEAQNRSAAEAAKSRDAAALEAYWLTLPEGEQQVIEAEAVEAFCAKYPTFAKACREGTLGVGKRGLLRGMRDEVMASRGRVPPEKSPPPTEGTNPDSPKGEQS